MDSTLSARSQIKTSPTAQATVRKAAAPTEAAAVTTPAKRQATPERTKDTISLSQNTLKDKIAEDRQEKAKQSKPTLANLTKPAERVELSVDKETNRFVARFLNKETGEIVRQMPSEEILFQDAELRKLLQDMKIDVTV